MFHLTSLIGVSKNTSYVTMTSLVDLYRDTVNIPGDQFTIDIQHHMVVTTPFHLAWDVLKLLRWPYPLGDVAQLRRDLAQFGQVYEM